jgi:hypothetical protein
MVLVSPIFINVLSFNHFFNEYEFEVSINFKAMVIKQQKDSKVL